MNTTDNRTTPPVGLGPDTDAEWAFDDTNDKRHHCGPRNRRRMMKMAREGRSGREGHSHGRGPRGPMGPGGPMGWPFGPGGPGGMPMGPGPWGPGGRRRGRRERGDVRAAVLLLIAEQPRHGYEIITEIADRSEGAWQLSPGSVYPVLKRLSREGLVEASDNDGRRVFTLTPEGRELVDAERDSWGEPWTQAARTDQDDAAANTERAALWQEAQQLAAAVWQVSQMNQTEDIEAATAALTEARKAIYRRLAE